MIFKYYSKAVGDYCAGKTFLKNGLMKSGLTYNSTNNTFG